MDFKPQKFEPLKDNDANLFLREKDRPVQHAKKRQDYDDGKTYKGLLERGDYRGPGLKEKALKQIIKMPDSLITLITTKQKERKLAYDNALAERTTPSMLKELKATASYFEEKEDKNGVGTLSKTEQTMFKNTLDRIAYIPSEEANIQNLQRVLINVENCLHLERLGYVNTLTEAIVKSSAYFSSNQYLDRLIQSEGDKLSAEKKQKLLLYRLDSLKIKYEFNEKSGILFDLRPTTGIRFNLFALDHNIKKIEIEDSLIGFIKEYVEDYSDIDARYSKKSERLETKEGDFLVPNREEIIKRIIPPGKRVFENSSKSIIEKAGKAVVFLGEKVKFYDKTAKSYEKNYDFKLLLEKKSKMKLNSAEQLRFDRFSAESLVVRENLKIAENSYSEFSQLLEGAKSKKFTERINDLIVRAVQDAHQENSSKEYFTKLTKELGSEDQAKKRQAEILESLKTLAFVFIFEPSENAIGSYYFTNHTMTMNLAWLGVMPEEDYEYTLAHEIEHSIQGGGLEYKNSDYENAAHLSDLAKKLYGKSRSRKEFYEVYKEFYGGVSADSVVLKRSHDYCTNRLELDARKEILIKFMEKHGIMKYGEKMTRETYDRLVSFLKEKHKKEKEVLGRIADSKDHNIFEILFAFTPEDLINIVNTLAGINLNNQTKYPGLNKNGVYDYSSDILDS